MSSSARTFLDSAVDAYFGGLTPRSREEQPNVQTKGDLYNKLKNKYMLSSSPQNSQIASKKIDSPKSIHTFDSKLSKKLEGSKRTSAVDPTYFGKYAERIYGKDSKYSPSRSKSPSGSKLSSDKIQAKQLSAQQSGRSVNHSSSNKDLSIKSKDKSCLNGEQKVNRSSSTIENLRLKTKTRKKDDTDNKNAFYASYEESLTARSATEDTSRNKDSTPYFQLTDRIQKLKGELERFEESHGADKKNKIVKKTLEPKKPSSNYFISPGYRPGTTKPDSDKISNTFDESVSKLSSIKNYSTRNDRYNKDESRYSSHQPSMQKSYRTPDMSLDRTLLANSLMISKQNKLKNLLENGDIFGFMQFDESRYIVLSHAKDMITQLDTKIQGIIDICCDAKEEIQRVLTSISTELIENDLGMSLPELEVLKTSMQTVLERFLDLEHIKDTSQTANYLINLRNMKDSTKTIERDISFLKHYIQEFNDSLKIQANLSYSELITESKSVNNVNETRFSGSLSPRNYVYTLNASSSSSKVWEVAISSDGEFIAVANQQSMLEIYSVTEKRLSQVFDCIDSEKIYSLAIGRKCVLLAASSDDRSIKIWDLRVRKMIHNFEESHEYPPWCIAISDDNKYLASSSVDNCIRLWDLDAGKLFHTFKNTLYNPLCKIYFDSESKFVISTSKDHSIKIWDVDLKVLKHTFLDAHDDSIYNISVERLSNNILASSSSDHTIRLWDLNKKLLLKTLPEEEKVSICGVSISPAATHLVSAYTDKSFKIWTLEDFKVMHHERDAHNGSLNTIAWSGDGKYIITTSKVDRTVKIWNFMHFVK